MYHSFTPHLFNIAWERLDETGPAYICSTGETGGRSGEIRQIYIYIIEYIFHAFLSKGPFDSSTQRRASSLPPPSPHRHLSVPRSRALAQVTLIHESFGTRPDHLNVSREERSTTTPSQTPDGHAVCAHTHAYGARRSAVAADRKSMSRADREGRASWTQTKRNKNAHAVPVALTPAVENVPNVTRLIIK